ncbi:alpha/beta hydrolase [Actinomadura harenae]|uniref:alpha/beta hydrolase n=1 Tax=Actinomadura harenae TaxID=2483351 RepID=UPI001F2C23BD|nr:alpha/beta hydrolase [Actinomadura harenae]
MPIPLTAAAPGSPPDDPERWTHDHRPSMRSRALSRVLYLGLRPLLQHVPGHAASLRAARSTVDAASLLMRAGQRARVLPLVDPRVETGEDAPPLVGEWVVSRDAGAEREAGGAILYLHGGGYVVCSPRTHRPITSRLAVETGLPVLAPHYRMAPEHPFPAPLEDAAAAYRWLLDRGVPASGIVLAGDSAGGHLAASLTAEILRTGLPRPAGALLFSPWVDLTCELSTREQEVARDPYISASTARRVARLVVGPAGFDDPRLALLGCPWRDAPPFLVQVGGAEVLRPEAEALADVLTGAGVDCELQVWTGQMHVFQILNRMLPEASAAMSEAARFVARVTAAGPVPAAAVA